LTSKTTPNDIPTFRKDPLLDLRSKVDVFVWNYPVLVKDVDVYLKLEKQLAKIYQLAGDVQDLRSVNYTQDDLDKALAPCLKAKEDFFADSKQYDYLNFLSQPSTTWADRKVSKVPGRFWSIANRTPSKKYTGFGNLAYLESGLLNWVLTNFPDLMALRELTVPANAELFHAYRKNVRSVSWLAAAFPPIFTNGSDPSKGLTTVKQFQSKLGKVHDDIVDYDYYMKKKRFEEAEIAKNQTRSDWRDTRSWVNTSNFLKVIGNLQKSLVQQGTKKRKCK